MGRHVWLYLLTSEDQPQAICIYGKSHLACKHLAEKAMEGQTDLLSHAPAFPGVPAASCSLSAPGPHPAPSMISARSSPFCPRDKCFFKKI